MLGLRKEPAVLHLYDSENEPPMITNLLASVIVTLVTNVATTDNAQYEQRYVACPDNWIGCSVLHTERGAVVKSATEKTETTTITEKTEFEVDVGKGKQRLAVSERVVCEQAKVYRLKQEWELARTYDPNDIIVLNSYGTNILTNVPSKYETDIIYDSALDKLRSALKAPIPQP